MPLMRVDDLNHHHKNAVAVGSRVSVEKKDFVSVGTVTFIEGDIIEIDLPQARYYKPGDEIKITVYSTNGFLILKSSVIAKDLDVIMILNPPDNQRLVQRREHPRIDVQNQGFIHSLRDVDNSVHILDEPVPFNMSNISLGGIGFIVAETIPLRAMMVAETELSIIGGVRCRIEISRRQPAGDGAYIGARFIDFPNDLLTSLRGFILRAQIDTRVKQRRAEAAM